MGTPFFLQVRIDDLLHILDFYGYAQDDSEITKIFILNIVCNIIDSAKIFDAIPLQENRIQLDAKPNHIGVSFSLIFKNSSLMNDFLEYNDEF